MSQEIYRQREPFDGISENGNSRSNLVYDNSSTHKDSGCYMKTSTGFILVFLAIFSAAAVGVIVTFAGNRGDLVCDCGNQNGNANSEGQTGGCPTPAPVPSTTPCPEVTCPACPTMSPTESSSHATMTSHTHIPTTPASPEVQSARIPTHLKPIHYDVTLRPDIFKTSPAEFSNRGHVKMTFECMTATNNITLHINQINVTENTVKVYNHDGSDGPGVAHVLYDTRLQFVIIHLNTMLTIGHRYQVAMDFIGGVKNDLDGLYYSSFKRDNNDVYLAITQFQPTDARKAFPCMDEPALKATFNITLERRPENNYITLSNMRQIDNQAVDNGFVADIYESTVKMPTYLLAFSVNDFVYEEGFTNKNVRMRSYSQREDSHRLNYSVDAGIRLLEAFEGYFEIDYPLPKLDQIALPDFSAGAMENWGLVTYRSTYLLYDKNLTTSAQEKRVVEIITHEFAHMWFGNIISPEWWDDLWLNEGFASFLESIGMDLIHPEWNVMDWFGIDVMYGAFRADSLPTSRPIYKMVQFPDEINSLFDTITYSKGASVIRMMWHFLGKERFRLGLKRYINANLYGNVAHADLWESLTNETIDDGNKVDVKDIMDTWILQRNYPIVTVTREDNNLKITQKRYVLGNTSVDNEPVSPFGYMWTIPFTYTTESEKIFNKTSSDVVWLNRTQSSHTFLINSVPANDWILGNLEQNGYYRVNYDDSNWMKLIQQLKADHQVLPASSRAQLINDVWALLNADEVDIQRALDIFDYLDKEEDYAPWYSALSELSNLDVLLRRRASYGNFEKMMRSKVTPIFEKLGMQTEKDQNINKGLLRSYIVRRACQFDITNCTDTAKLEFENWRQNLDTYFIDPDIKPTVLCTAIRLGGVEEWDFLFGRYENSTASEQTIIQGALACSREDWILNRYLDYALDETKIRKQDARIVIQSIGSNPAGLYKAWSFVINRWQFLVKEYGLGFGSLNRILSSLTSSFHTEFEKSQVEYLKSIHPADASSQVAFDSTLAVIDNNIAWVNKHMQRVENWLDNMP